MNPVWVEFPKIPWGSMGWRMGPGEDYWHKWIGWYKALAAEQRLIYRQHWPESGRWVGFYEFIEHGTPPPWIEQDRKKVEAAAIPPRLDETRIDDTYRIRWLVTSYMKRIGQSFAKPNGADWAVAYEEPNGAQWLLVVTDAEARWLERVHT